MLYNDLTEGHLFVKLKDIKKKYKNYNIVEFGHRGDIPFSCLPKELQGLRGKEYEKVANEMEPYEFEVIEKPFTTIDITHCLFGGKQKIGHKYDGDIYVYWNK